MSVLGCFLEKVSVRLTWSALFIPVMMLVGDPETVPVVGLYCQAKTASAEEA